jgi:phage FluMu protein Com
MKCPYCNKLDFIPEVVLSHTEAYGGGCKNFRCLHCHKVVSAHCSLKVIVANVTKTESESDW